MSYPNYPAGTSQPEKPRRTHKLRWALIGAGAVIVALIAIGAAAAGSGANHHGGNAMHTASPAASHSACPPGTHNQSNDPQSNALNCVDNSQAPAPAPVPSPAGKLTGSCDINLGNGLGGTLTAQVNAMNTGNIGIIVRLKVAWPLQGYPPIIQRKTVRVRTGNTRQVEFNVPVNDTQVNSFQDAQLAATGDPCHYHASITGTFGNAKG